MPVHFKKDDTAVVAARLGPNQNKRGGTPAEEPESVISGLYWYCPPDKEKVERSSDTEMSRRLFVQGSGTKNAIDYLRMF